MFITKNSCNVPVRDPIHQYEKVAVTSIGYWVSRNSAKVQSSKVTKENRGVKSLVILCNLILLSGHIILLKLQVEVQPNFYIQNS